jgi:hypothetical protein
MCLQQYYIIIRLKTFNKLKIEWKGKAGNTRFEGRRRYFREGRLVGPGASFPVDLTRSEK